MEDVIVQRAEPFYVSASVAFKWDPFESARTYTNEDDLLGELLGRDEETIDTMPRSLRVDFVLKTSLPYEIQVPLLSLHRWRAWAHATHEGLHTLLPTEAPEHRGRQTLRSHSSTRTRSPSRMKLPWENVATFPSEWMRWAGSP